jgi:hypothetical protein
MTMTSNFDVRPDHAAARRAGMPAPATPSAVAALLALAVLALGGCSRPAEEPPQQTAVAESPAATAAPAQRPRRPRQKPVFFKVGFPTEKEGTFILRLTDPEKIEAARNAIRDPENNPHSVMGILVKKPARFNPGWNFHLKPRTVELFEVAAEVCDATPQYVEEHLEEACGAFLPDCRWCPWTSKVLAEVPPPAGPAPAAP